MLIRWIPGEEGRGVLGWEVQHWVWGVGDCDRLYRFQTQGPWVPDVIFLIGEADSVITGMPSRGRRRSCAAPWVLSRDRG